MSLPQHWIAQSLIWLVFLVPIWMAIPVFKEHFGVPPNVFCVYYFFGTVIAVAIFGVPSARDLVTPVWPIILVFVVGLTLGGLANLAGFTATAIAPNPGLAVAIGNGASVGAFLLTVWFSALWPRYFHAAQFNMLAFLGVLLTIGGVVLIAVATKPTH